DGGGEYEKWMEAHLKGSGIIHETTAPYSPDQNGVAERANRTIMERVKAIIAEFKLDKRLWMELAETVVYLKNPSGKPFLGLLKSDSSLVCLAGLSASFY